MKTECAQAKTIVRVNWEKMADRKYMVVTQIRHFLQYFLVFFVKKKQELLLIRVFF
jgi:hypothetical protein